MTPLIKHMLDVMDAKPDYNVMIVANDPEHAMATLKTLMEKVDTTDKYVSRLQRIAVM